MKKIFLFLFLVLLAVSCSKKIDYEKLALDKTDTYVESINNKDFDLHKKLFDNPDIKWDNYRRDFFDKIEKVEVLDMNVVHNDILLVIVELKFKVIYNDKKTSDFTRYFGYYKEEDMKLKEILNKLIK